METGWGSKAEGKDISDGDVEDFLRDFDDVDSNHDGGLSLDEVREILPGASEDRFNELDTDGDGVLSIPELRAAVPPPGGGSDEGCQCPSDGNKSSWKNLLNQLVLGGAFVGLLMLGGRGRH